VFLQTEVVSLHTKVFAGVQPLGPLCVPYWHVHVQFLSVLVPTSKGLLHRRTALASFDAVLQRSFSTERREER
jgi:hypothetical protein